MADVEYYVQKNFAAPIDTWALGDAQLLMDKAQKRRGAFIFPVDKLFSLLQKVPSFTNLELSHIGAELNFSLDRYQEIIGWN